MLTLMNAGKWWPSMLLAALLLWGVAPGQASAAVIVDSILVNNGSSATVAPGAAITVTVTVTLTGGSRWRSTAFTTSPASSSLSFCSLAPDINDDGTWTRTFTMNAPPSANVYSLNVVAWANPNCNGAASPTKTLPDGINTNLAAALDHVRIKHDGDALTCSPEPMTLEACADASCTTQYTGHVSVTLGSGAGTWSANPVTITGGSTAITLSNSTSGAVTLAGSVTSPTAVSTGAVCYNGSTANACTLVFSTGSCQLDAVETGKAPNTPIYTKLSTGTFALDVLALNGGVVDPTSRARVDATLVKEDAAGNCSSAAADVIAPTVSVTLTSANAGRAALTFTPNKAARVVRVRMVSGSLVGCSSDNFAVRPASLALTISNINTALDPASATAVPVLTAGSSAFTMEAQVGNGYDGAPVINQKRVDAAGLTAGTVAGAFTSASLATSWKASGNAFTYAEVGYFKLLPYAVYDESFADIDEAKSPQDCFNDANFANNGNIADPNTPQGGLLGCYFGSGVESSYFGRYIPARLVLSGTSLTNRSAIPTCAASTFSYTGEPMEQAFTLTAQNGVGATTENYEGAFARLNLATGLGLGAIDAPASGTRTPFAVCGATPAHPCVAIGAVADAFDNGVVNVTLPLTVFRGTSPAGPYDNFKLGVAPVDSDLVTLASYDVDTSNVVAGAANHALVGSTKVRYGRLQIDNAYGSELLNLSTKISAQFWNLTGYATNTLDSCTDPVFKDFVAATDYLGGLNPAIMPNGNRGPAATLVNGVSKMVLAKPSPAPAGKGSVTLRSKLDYLPGSGRATFGVYKAGPVIYVRETY